LLGHRRLEKLVIVESVERDPIRRLHLAGTTEDP